MGHRNHIGQSYSELSKAKLELEYLRVEPFLTVYGQVEDNLEIKEDVARLESRIVDLNRNIEDQKRTIEEQTQLSEQIVQVGEGLKRWQEEKGELEAKIAGIVNFQKLVLEQPDVVILEFIKDVRRQLEEQGS